MTSPTTVRRGWLHEEYPNPLYRWVVLDRLMRDDERGIELTYRPLRPEDVICGARTVEPGISWLAGYPASRLSKDHEVVCTWVGDHGEAPHIGVGDICEHMTRPGMCSECPERLVIVGFAIRPEVAPGVAADQGVWGPNESEEP